MRKSYIRIFPTTYDILEALAGKGWYSFNQLYLDIRDRISPEHAVRHYKKVCNRSRNAGAKTDLPTQILKGGMGLLVKTLADCRSTGYVKKKKEKDPSYFHNEFSLTAKGEERYKEGRKIPGDTYLALCLLKDKGRQPLKDIAEQSGLAASTVWRMNKELKELNGRKKCQESSQNVSNKSTNRNRKGKGLSGKAQRSMG